MTPTLPPGPRLPRPLQTLGWMERPLPFVARAHARYGDVFTIRIINDTWVVLADPEDVKQVFTGDPAIFHAGEGNDILLPFLGPDSVLLVDDERHLRQRRLLLPPFHGEKMRAQIGLMSEIAEREVETWPIGEPFAVHKHMQRLTLEVIMRVVFGVADDDPRLDELRRALVHMLDTTASRRQMLKLIAYGPQRATKKRIFADVMEPVDVLVKDIVQRRRGMPDLAERSDILSVLLQATDEDGTPMGDDELRDELVTLLVAGHETTATAMSWAIERLTRHPEALARLTEEVRAGEEAYLDAVIKETLRLRPVLPFVVRKLTQPQRIAGWDLPAGTNVTPSIHLIHRRPDLYPDPAAFVPDRWLDRRPGPYTWFPFGGGVRRCLGASFAETEMRAVLAAVVSRLELRPARPLSERVDHRVITLVPARGGEVVAARAARTAEVVAAAA